ncbi:unnamed protein product, partial [Strongylus vulgaris]
MPSVTYHVTFPWIFFPVTRSLTVTSVENLPSIGVHLPFSQVRRDIEIISAPVFSWKRKEHPLIRRRD